MRRSFVQRNLSSIKQRQPDFETPLLNKTQQDTLLPHIETGLVVLIGETTNYPEMVLNDALLSRAQVYERKQLKWASFIPRLCRA